MRQKIKQWIAMISLFAIVIVGCVGCGKQNTEDAQAKSCFIYTDGLLDDLCAIEYLSTKYDNAVILLQNAEGLVGNDYASQIVQDKSAFFQTVSAWFSKVTDYSDSTDIAKMDFYILAPLTEFAEILKDNPSLLSNHTLLMAGVSDGPDGAGEEWNAAADKESYRYVTEHMTDLTQVTAPECEAAFTTNGYPFEAQFLDEYTTQMKSINDNACCYDLQAVVL